MTIEDRKETLYLEIDRYLGLLRGMDPIPLDHLNNIQEFRVLVEIANLEELTVYEQEWAEWANSTP